jgi:hypothetical protein
LLIKELISTENINERFETGKKLGKFKLANTKIKCNHFSLSEMNIWQKIAMQSETIRQIS